MELSASRLDELVDARVAAPAALFLTLPALAEARATGLRPRCLLHDLSKNHL